MARASESKRARASESAQVAELGDLSAHTLETAVQVAAMLTVRNGAEPGAGLLARCGQKHVEEAKRAGADPAEVAKWAIAEARRRSPSLDHKDIVAQAMKFERLEDPETAGAA